MRVALINDGVVVNVIEASLEFAQTLGYDTVVESEEAAPGWLWVDGTFVAPPSDYVPPEPIPEPPQPRHITRLAFLQRITMNEHVAIELASETDASMPIDVRVRGATLRKMLQLVNAASWIDLDRPDTREMVMQLEQMGLLAPGRALEILDNEILPIEVPTVDANLQAPL